MEMLGWFVRRVWKREIREVYADVLLSNRLCIDYESECRFITRRTDKRKPEVSQRSKPILQYTPSTCVKIDIRIIRSIPIVPEPPLRFSEYPTFSESNTSMASRRITCSRQTLLFFWKVRFLVGSKICIVYSPNGLLVDHWADEVATQQCNLQPDTMISIHWRMPIAICSLPLRRHEVSAYRLFPWCVWIDRYSALKNDQFGLMCTSSRSEQYCGNR